MREVQGHLTDDGRFFERRSEAEFHEAYAALFKAYVEFTGIHDQKRFSVWVGMLSNLRTEIRRLLDADEKRQAFEPAEPQEHQADDGLGEAFDEAAVEQSGQRYERVPDMGMGAFEEAVRERGSVNEFGGGGDDAQSVRGRETLAALAATGVEGARGLQRDEAFRPEVEGDRFHGGLDKG